ncbi:MAG TPA: hypothetical protein EYG73_09025 [Arcobacter sp.]|nr:hypothetical protein [Arcobacter sp.]
MNEMIIEAIKSKKVMQFIYDNALRIVEPYTYGVSKKGKDQLRAFQIEGGSNSSNTLGWRPFTVDKMENIRILDDSFEPNREGYNPNDKAMIEIYITV